MPRYHVHFIADYREPLPPVAELPSVEAGDPAKALDELLAQSCFRQDPAIRWARVVVGVHDNGVPSLVMRFPVTSERTSEARDGVLLGRYSF